MIAKQVSIGPGFIESAVGAEELISGIEEGLFMVAIFVVIGVKGRNEWGMLVSPLFTGMLVIWIESRNEFGPGLIVIE
jgi:hypothetical protein